MTEGDLNGRFMPLESDRFDVIVIGAGHNGLTCAGYLARAGYKVKVVERRGVVGGAAVTEEFHPGFRNSVALWPGDNRSPRGFVLPAARWRTSSSQP
jgi:glycine/D-amino acid oxidase-like deaminating enzyme